MIMKVLALMMSSIILTRKSSFIQTGSESKSKNLTVANNVFSSALRRMRDYIQVEATRYVERKPHSIRQIQNTS